MIKFFKASVLNIAPTICKIAPAISDIRIYVSYSFSRPPNCARDPEIAHAISKNRRRISDFLLSFLFKILEKEMNFKCLQNAFVKFKVSYDDLAMLKKILLI